MRVACVGDVMLDVIVSPEADLVFDDDVDARIAITVGGQAANVAAWTVALGGSAVVFGPRGPGTGRLAIAALAGMGIEVVGPEVDRNGTVISLIGESSRSLISDKGTAAYLDDVAPGPWLDGSDWLYLSGYPLLRANKPDLLVELAAGRKVAVDLSSAAMIKVYGVERFRDFWTSLEPAVVFANDEEWKVAGADFDGILVQKHGDGGATFDGVHYPAVTAEVVDVTGAGDALAAGWLVGGPELAMETAARCVALLGAQPGR